MSDRLTIEQRHNNMAAIRGRDTKPEILVRKFLWSRGFRYRLNHPRLPGKPDIVLRKYRTCILVNGCFWHFHQLSTCKRARIPKSNIEFWAAKLTRNMNRDKKEREELIILGWRVFFVWECQLGKHASKTLNSLMENLKNLGSVQK